MMGQTGRRLSLRVVPTGRTHRLTRASRTETVSHLFSAVGSNPNRIWHEQLGQRIGEGRHVRMCLATNQKQIRSSKIDDVSATTNTSSTTLPLPQRCRSRYARFPIDSLPTQFWRFLIGLSTWCPSLCRSSCPFSMVFASTPLRAAFLPLRLRSIVAQ